MILKPYPPAERPSLRLKICAAGALIGRRRDWGFQRKWEGNYLFLVCHAICLPYYIMSIMLLLVDNNVDACRQGKGGTCPHLEMM